MATVDIVPVVLFFSVTPEDVYVRIRTYAGEKAIEESGHYLPREKFGATVLPEDVCKQVPVEGAIWGGDPEGTALRKDILPKEGEKAAPPTDEEVKAALAKQIEELQAQLDALTTKG